MYKNYLPDVLPENWMLADLDEENGYLEFLGYEGEFLVSVMEHSNENPKNPYFLNLSQMKGILSRFDFESLEWQEWYPTAEEALESALKLIVWINQNYAEFVPVTLRVFVSFGTEDQIELIRKHFDNRLAVYEFQNQRLIFREVNLTWGVLSHSDASLNAILQFYKSSKIPTQDMLAGFLTNEKFELIEDLRPVILEHLTIENNA